MAGLNPFQNLITSFEPGERIFTEGEVGTTMFIVQSGRVRLFRDSGGKPAAIAEMEKGDFFGEMSLLEAIPRNMSAEAVDHAELIEINSTTFDRMIRSNIEIAVRMLRKLSGRLQKAEALISAQRIAAAAELQTASVPAVPSRAAASASFPSAAETPRAPRAPAPSRPAVAPSIAGPSSVSATPPGRTSGTSPNHASHGSLSATRPPIPLSTVPPPARTAPLQALLSRPAPAQAAAGEGPRLQSESGESVFPIHSDEALLGRYDPVTETQPEVDLTLIDIKRSVSRRHARITRKDGSFYLTEEVGALNGTFVNGVKLITGKPAPLKDEDRVSLGTVQLVFRA